MHIVFSIFSLHYVVTGGTLEKNGSAKGTSESQHSLKPKFRLTPSPKIPRTTDRRGWFRDRIICIDEKTTVLMQQQLRQFPTDICLTSSLKLPQLLTNSVSVLKNPHLKKTLPKLNLPCCLFVLFTIDVVNNIQPFCYWLPLTYANSSVFISFY